MIAGWAILTIGAGLMLAPGMLNPMAPINGATLIGLIVVAIGSWLVLKEER